MKTRISFFFVSCSLLLGCEGPSNPPDDLNVIRTWATTASAVAVYANFHQPLAWADGESLFSDEACPRTEDDGAISTITGGCVDSSGEEWLGLARVVREQDGGRQVVLESYGSRNEDGEAMLASGSMLVRALSERSREFDVDLVRESEATTIAIAYLGQVEGDYRSATRWNGAGTVERKGRVEPLGVVEAETLDEVIDEAVCSGQPASGRTTLELPRGTAVVTYDGATDCDDDQAALLSVDGRDRGRLSGIACALRAGSVGAGPLAWAALIGLAWRVRARSRRPAA